MSFRAIDCGSYWGFTSRGLIIIAPLNQKFDTDEKVNMYCVRNAGFLRLLPYLRSAMGPLARPAVSTPTHISSSLWSISHNDVKNVVGAV